MAKQIIDIGTTPNDDTGDPIRVCFDKSNDNFTELYDSVGYIDNATTSALSLSTLNSTYSTAVVGFKVYCKDISGGGLVYCKITGGWVSIPITVVS
jgi:hypothetical protein